MIPPILQVVFHYYLKWNGNVNGNPHFAAKVAAFSFASEYPLGADSMELCRRLPAQKSQRPAKSPLDVFLWVAGGLSEITVHNPGCTLPETLRRPKTGLETDCRSTARNPEILNCEGWDCSMSALAICTR